MAVKESPDLTQWVEDYTSDLCSWALHKVSDEELAKDLVQEGAEKAGRNPDEVEVWSVFATVLNPSHEDYLRISYDLVRRGVRFGANNWTPIRARSGVDPVSTRGLAGGAEDAISALSAFGVAVCLHASSDGPSDR